MEDTRTGNTSRRSETGRLAGGLTAAEPASGPINQYCVV